MSKRTFAFFIAALSLVAIPVLPGCDNSRPVDPDAGPLPDAGPVLEMSHLFGACEQDWQCPGEGAICRTAAETGNPMGFCTIPCEDRTPCDYAGVYHFCATRTGETQSYCERRCLNGLDCGREAYTCQLPESGPGICFGLCSSDEQCGTGTICDEASGQCVTSEPSGGGVTGDPCTAPEDCRSQFCISEAGSGWPGGHCIGQCILPLGFTNTSFWSEPALPQATCPSGELCLPLLGSNTRGDPGACLVECNDTTDCRSGYTCRKSFMTGSGGTASFTNGVCWPAG